MSRIPRNRLGSGIFHVINRAIDRRFVFQDDADKSTFLNLLQKGAKSQVLTPYHWVIKQRKQL